MPLLRRGHPGRGAEVPVLPGVPRPGPPRRRGGPRDLERFLTPAGRPASAIAAGYLGLFSLLPFFGIFAIIAGVVAQRTLRRNPHVLGRGRAWFGLVMGLVMTLVYAIPIILAIIGAIDAANGRRPRF